MKLQVTFKKLQVTFMKLQVALANFADPPSEMDPDHTNYQAALKAAFVN